MVHDSLQLLSTSACVEPGSDQEAAKMARQLAPSVKLKEGARRQMQDQLEMVVTKQLKQEDRELQSIRECQFLLSRLFYFGTWAGQLQPVHGFFSLLNSKIFYIACLSACCNQAHPDHMEDPMTTV